MKRLALIGLAAAAIPGAALAQILPPDPPPGAGAPPPGAGGPPDDDPSARRAMRDEMAEIHRTGRSAMLAAISPAHRTLLASVVGDLAIAAMPDVDAAAKRLDAALSPAESKGVFDADDGMRERMRSAFGRMRGDDGPARPRPAPGMAATANRSAGSILIRSTVALGGPPREPAR